MQTKMNKIFKNQAYIFEGKVGDIYKNTPMLRIYSKDRWIQFFIWDNSNERSFPAYNYCEIVNDKYEVEQMIADFINNPEKLIHILQNGFNALNKEIKESNEKVIQYKPKRLNNKNHKEILKDSWELRIVFYANNT